MDDKTPVPITGAPDVGEGVGAGPEGKEETKGGPRPPAATPHGGVTGFQAGMATPRGGVTGFQAGMATPVGGGAKPAVAQGPMRSLATSLDALVLSCRAAQQQKTFDLAGRVLDLWRRHARVKLRLTCGLLMAGEEVVLGVSAAEGTWLLPAYMAGLRELALMPHCDEAELMQLAEALSRLEPVQGAISRFEAWVRADGAEGFFVSLDDGLSQGERAALEDPRARLKELSRQRVQAAEDLTNLAIQAAATVSGEYSRAREELQQPMKQLARAVQDGTLRQDSQARRELLATVEDPIYWAEAEMDAALAYEVLRTALPPRTLARRTVSLMSRSADLKLLGLLERLSEHKDPYARTFKQALQGGSLGQALARDIVLDDEAMEKLQAVLDQPEMSQVATALITSLLERSCEERAVAESLLSLMGSAGLETVFKHVELGALTGEAAEVVCWLLIKAKAPARCMAEMVSGLAPGPCLGVLSRLPDASLWPLNSRIGELLARASGSVRHDLITMLLQREEPRWAKVLGDALKETRGSGWQQRSVTALGEALARRKLARSYIVPMVRDNEVSAEVRLSLIEVLQKVGTRRALEEGVKFNVKELLYPSEVREAMKSARQQLKTEGDA